MPGLAEVLNRTREGSIDFWQSRLNVLEMLAQGIELALHPEQPHHEQHYDNAEHHHRDFYLKISHVNEIGQRGRMRAQEQPSLS